MWTVVLLMSLAADPSAALVLARKTGVPGPEAAALTEKLAPQVRVPGLLAFTESQRRLAALGLKDATTCNGVVDCHVEVGRALKVDSLVLVSVSQIGADQSLALEYFDVSTGKVMTDESMLLSARGEVPAGPIGRFNDKVNAWLQLGVDTPLAQQLDLNDPRVSLKDPLLTARVERSHVPSFITGGAAVVALGVGAGLLISGLVQRQQLDGTTGPDGIARSPLTGAEAIALNEATSVQFAVAGGAAAAGLGLLGVALALW